MADPGANSLPAKRELAIELLSDGILSQKQIAKAVGVNVNSISNWKREPDFMDKVVARSREKLRESLPQIYQSLATESKKGKDKHIKIFLDHLETLENLRSKEVTISFSWTPPNE